MKEERSVLDEIRRLTEDRLELDNRGWSMCKSLEYNIGKAKEVIADLEKKKEEFNVLKNEIDDIKYISKFIHEIVEKFHSGSSYNRCEGG